jgi:UDP:flavonoid glycosyltransferase YjiC (YdhE family)
MIVFYTSGHGFGHATRDMAVLQSLQRTRPEVTLVVRTSVPRWFFDQSTHQPVDVQAFETDPGMVQKDSLTLDEAATARAAADFYQNFDERVAAEARWLREAGARAVVADVPPLACAAAAQAGIPSIVMANFTWDWIYEALPGFDRAAPGVRAIIERAYGTATHALRLPLHGGFAPMAPVVRDIPLVARRASHSRTAVRAALGIPSERPVVLASFGGHDSRMPYETVSRRQLLTLLLTEFEARSNATLPDLPSLRCVGSGELAARGMRYEDLVAAADVVVSKPGYGIVSECIANGAALLYTSRGAMIEYDVLVEEMPRWLRCRYIDRQELLDGRWEPAIMALLDQPPPLASLPATGADVAARFIAEVVNH